MKRPFIQLTDNSIQFDNGNIIVFTGNDTFINGNLVSVQEFMTYLLSDQYKTDCGYDE
jgi:hypothetical protein